MPPVTQKVFKLPASTATVASLRLPHGTAPTSPVDGDEWTTTAGKFVRINGTTKQMGTASAADLTSGTLADARVAASNVTQHQTSLSIAASQLTGTLVFARLPAVSGSWDVGLGNTLTLTRAVAMSSTLDVTGVATFTTHTRINGYLRMNTSATASASAGDIVFLQNRGIRGASADEASTYSLLRLNAAEVIIGNTGQNIKLEFYDTVLAGTVSGVLSTGVGNSGGTGYRLLRVPN